jgi:hypothetical protein
MKIEYEVGDCVFHYLDYGGCVLEITKVRKLGVVVIGIDGDTWYLGKNQIEPHPGTVSKAKITLTPTPDRKLRESHKPTRGYVLDEEHPRFHTDHFQS